MLVALFMLSAHAMHAPLGLQAHRCAVYGHPSRVSTLQASDGIPRLRKRYRMKRAMKRILRKETGGVPVLDPLAQDQAVQVVSWYDSGVRLTVAGMNEETALVDIAAVASILEHAPEQRLAPAADTLTFAGKAATKFESEVVQQTMYSLADGGFPANISGAWLTKLSEADVLRYVRTFSPALGEAAVRAGVWQRLMSTAAWRHELQVDDVLLEGELYSIDSFFRRHKPGGEAAAECDWLDGRDALGRPVLTFCSGRHTPGMPRGALGSPSSPGRRLADPPSPR